jgi:hypothetical protein
MVGRQVRAAGFERALTAPERQQADRVEDDVVGLAVPAEVLLRVVDDLVGSERPDELGVLGVAHPGDVGLEIPGELNGRGPDGA